jgi:hypothetical protein
MYPSLSSGSIGRGDFFAILEGKEGRGGIFDGWRPVREHNYGTYIQISHGESRRVMRKVGV